MAYICGLGVLLFRMLVTAHIVVKSDLFRK